jgi:hypothetical protein
MASSVSSKPSFLQRARRVDISQEVLKEDQEDIQPKKEPLFLSRAKKVPDKEDDSKFQSDEETQREIERNTAQGLSRIGETVLGAPGDIASFLTGLFGKEQNILPTSQSLREKSEKYSQGYTKPKNEFEEGSGELLSDFASMALPGSGHYSFARNIGVPVIGNLVKQGLKYSGSDEKNQAYGKVGTMVALDLISRRSGGVKKYAGSLFQKADEAIPKGVSVDAKGLEKSLTALEKELAKGGKRPTTTKSLEKIAEIKGEIKNGKIDAKALAAYRPSINEAIEEMGGFNIELPKKLKPKAIFNLNQVKKETIKTLEHYGEKFNPEFLKANKSANEAWAAYENSNKIAKFLHDKVPFSPKSKAVQALFSYSPIAGIAAGAYKLGALGMGVAGASVGAYQGFKVFERVRKSPTLRKYYTNVLKEAAAGNGPATAKNLKALDTLLKDIDLDPSENQDHPQEFQMDQ